MYWKLMPVIMQLEVFCHRKIPQGELRPVAFFSRKLQGSKGQGQQGWAVREKETYAIVLMLQKFRELDWQVSDIYIKVLTDHQSLQGWFQEDLKQNGRQRRTTRQMA